MSLTVANSGTVTPVINTPSTLDTETPSSGTIYQLEIDTSAMQNGDVLVLTIKKATLSGGTRQVFQVATYQHVQGQPIKLSIPVPVAAGASAEFDLNQTAGTARAYPWTVYHL